jgi:hypothetical protein
LQGRNIRRTFESVSSVFSPSCISHTLITKPDWTRVRIGGVSLPDAIQCWVGETQPDEEQEEDETDDEQDGEDDRRLSAYSLNSDQQPPQPAVGAAGLATDQVFLAEKYASSLTSFPVYHNGDTSSGQNKIIIASTALTTSSPPLAMMADSPELRRQRFRVNANLVRSIGDETGGHHSNSMSHRIRKVRHRHNITDNRTGQQQQQLMRADGIVGSRCRPSDPLEKKIRCAQEENRQHLQDNTVERTNRDLVRSLGAADSTADTATRSSNAKNAAANRGNDKQRRRRRRRKKRRQIHIEGEETMTKEERRTRRREERRRLKRLAKQRRAERKERKERKEKEEAMVRRQEEEKKKEEEEAGRRQRRAEKRRNKRGTCRSKLVDTCSWPQCNRSCPKLHNPVTG